MTLDDLLAHFPKPQRAGAGWKVVCPAHADKNPSLSVTERDGKLLLHCHAGCTTETVCEQLGIKLGDLNSNCHAPSEPGPIVAEYNYTDESGRVLFQVTRHEPKDFRQRKPNGNGGWIGNINGVRRVLYNLPEVSKADHVVVTEGEKDVAAVRGYGFVGTCNPMGAGKWRAEFSESLRGKYVTIIPDNDEAGLKHAEEVARSLHRIAASVAICKLPEPLKNLSEWPLSTESLVDLIKKAPAW